MWEPGRFQGFYYVCLFSARVRVKGQRSASETQRTMQTSERDPGAAPGCRLWTILS